MATPARVNPPRSGKWQDPSKLRDVAMRHNSNEAPLPAAAAAAAAPPPSPIPPPSPSPSPVPSRERKTRFPPHPPPEQIVMANDLQTYEWHEDMKSGMPSMIAVAAHKGTVLAGRMRLQLDVAMLTASFVDMYDHTLDPVIRSAVEDSLGGMTDRGFQLMVPQPELKKLKLRREQLIPAVESLIIQVVANAELASAIASHKLTPKASDALHCMGWLVHGLSFTFDRLKRPLSAMSVVCGTADIAANDILYSLGETLRVRTLEGEVVLEVLEVPEDN